MSQINILQKIKKNLSQVLGHVWMDLFLERLRRFYRLIRAATEKFLSDNSTIRANAIAYAIVISVIPLLTILVRFASVDRVTIRANLATFLAANGMVDSTELLSILDEILGRADQIAGLGVLFMLYSATNLIKNLEDAFNYIYRARQERPMLYRFSLYIAAFAVLPTLVIFSAQGMRLALTRLQPANYTSIVSHAGEYWISADDGKIWHTDLSKFNSIDLYQRANTGAAFRDIFIDVDENRIGQAHEIVGQDFYQASLQRTDFYDIFALRSVHDTLYAFSRNGLILYSKDAGQTWDYRRLNFKLTEVYSPEVLDVHVDENGGLLLLVNINSQTGLVIRDPAGIWNYRPLDGVFKRIFSVHNVVPDARSIFKNGLYITGKGRYLYSADFGKEWQGPFMASYGDSNVYIGSMQATPEGDMYLAGSNASFWIDTDTSQIRPDLRIDGATPGVRAFEIDPVGRMVLYGDDGLFRFSPDHGRTWLHAANSELVENEFQSHLVTPDGSILLVSENEKLIRISNPHQLSTRDQHGFSLVQFDLKILSQMPLWISTISRLLLGTATFIISLILFVLVYRFIPNAPVSWKAALTGSSITSLALLGFFIIFRIIISSVSMTGYIYGVWAAIPLGMLMVLSSTQIILFGLEIAYVVQHPLLYRYQGTTKMEQGNSIFWNSLVLLSLIYHRLYGQNSALTDDVAVHYFQNNASRLDTIREVLLAAKLISYKDATGEYYPVRPASAIKINVLREILLEACMRVPESLRDSRKSKYGADFHKASAAILNDLKKHVQSHKSDLNLAELLPMLADHKKIKKT